jgi:hypothetical protein
MIWYWSASALHYLHKQTEVPFDRSPVTLGSLGGGTHTSGADGQKGPPRMSF